MVLHSSRGLWVLQLGWRMSCCAFSVVTLQVCTQRMLLFQQCHYSYNN